MKRFDNTKPRYSHLFKSRVIFVNFLLERRMNLTYEVIGDQLPNLEDQGNSNYMRRQVLTSTLNSSSKIIPSSQVAFKFEISPCFCVHN